MSHIAIANPSDYITTSFDSTLLPDNLLQQLKLHMRLHQAHVVTFYDHCHNRRFELGLEEYPAPKRLYIPDLQATTNSHQAVRGLT